MKGKTYYPAVAMFARAFEEMLHARANTTFRGNGPLWNSDQMIALAEDSLRRLTEVARDQRQRTPEEQVAFDTALSAKRTFTRDEVRRLLIGSQRLHEYREEILSVLDEIDAQSPRTADASRHQGGRGGNR